VSQFLKQANILHQSLRSNAVVLGTDLQDIALGNNLAGVDSTITVG
jgi:hypothetical protein